MATKCPMCGELALSSRNGEFRFVPPKNIPGGEMVVPGAEWLECGSCGKRILPPALDQALDRLRYERLGLLTPAEIKEVRERAGKSQADMAGLLGVGEKTYTRWESGRSIQNRSSDNLIRLADGHPEQFLYLEAQRDPKRSNVIRGYFDELPRLKGANDQAMAAHGAELDEVICSVLRERLRMLAEDRKKG